MTPAEQHQALRAIIHNSAWFMRALHAVNQLGAPLLIHFEANPSENMQSNAHLQPDVATWEYIEVPSSSW